MEKFTLNKKWRAHKFMGFGYPLIILIGMLVLYVSVIVPSRGQAVEFEFKNKNWTLLVVVGLVIWAVFEIISFIKANNFYIGLTENTIQVGNDLVNWIDISKVEYKNAAGDNPAILLHIKSGKILKIPAAIEALAYIKGFIESHTTHIQQSKS